ncbi:hypothetical protein Pan241w_26600 [Gimesia alba]|uniref:Uncharacterized protein n=1 Tax=Gimesia alba TaxID=2527973 RepID=A0A517RFF3_9PLAN|nr:hypothetical protein Pan241w_26600 [Gimesia alba]
MLFMMIVWLGAGVGWWREPVGLTEYLFVGEDLEEVDQQQKSAARPGEGADLVGKDQPSDVSGRKPSREDVVPGDL